MNGVDNISNKDLALEAIPSNVKRWDQINDFALSFDVNNYYKQIEKNNSPDELSELRKELIQIQRFVHWDTIDNDEALKDAIPILEKIKVLINKNENT